ncbi:MAG: TIR domain-containing protein [Bacilli bacterium]|nr:TIR domain-containing protein [Bacilli bacterium]
MKEKEYKYDAFISYRHCELDKFVAENLHRILESYELPKNLKEKLNIQGRTIKRVFRDQEELPLSSNLEDPILEALHDSKYLIVICSPRLKDSLWCKKEIQTFKKLRGRKNIICVLIEGEPSDSFPEEVLTDEVEKTLKNGKVKKEKILIEPLAADVRGNDKKEVLKKIKEEKLRLVAAMYNLDYDDLKQRHKLRRQKQILTTSIVVAAACILFTLYTSIMLIKINNQQKILKLHQALSLSSKSEDYLNKDNRYDAIKSSYQALTKFNGVKMPYTSNAEYALVESLGLYDVGSSYKSVSQIETKGVTDCIKSSPNNKYAAVYDESDEITLFNSKTLKKIGVYEAYATDDTFSFVGDNIFSYIDKKGNINLIDIKTGKQINQIKRNESYTALQGAKTGEYLSYIDNKTLYIYNIKENKIVTSIHSKDPYKKEIFYSEDSNYIFTATSENSFDINKEEYMTIHVIETKTGKEINNVVLNAGYMSGILTKGNNAYLLLNRSIGQGFNLLAVSYDFINNNINWTTTKEGNWGKFINRSYPENTNNLAIVHYNTVDILNADTGEDIISFTANSEIINIYSYYNKEIYLIFLNNGSVNYINMEYKNSIEYNGKYELNLSRYKDVTLSNNGFLLIPDKENRVILYEANSNKKIKKTNKTIEYNIDKSVKYTDYDKLKKEYNMKNKSLVDKMFYDDKKELLFVNYTNEDIAIYNVKTKKLLKTLNNVGKVETYFGRDIYNRIYIGDISNSYILDNNYDNVGHIKSLRKIDKDKLFISNNGSIYSIKVYTLKDILKEAENYLK